MCIRDSNKCDLATEEQIDTFRKYVEEKGLTFVPISAAVSYTHLDVYKRQAQGDTTDDLITKAAEITHNPSAREMDMLLAAGEEISICLLYTSRCV